MKNLDGLQIVMVQMPISDRPCENAHAFVKKVREAACYNAHIVVGSEMMIPKYLIGDRFEDEAFLREVDYWNQWIIKRLADLKCVVVFGSIGFDPDDQAVGEDGRRRKYNAAFVVQGGRQIYNEAGLPFAIKTLQPNYRMFDDDRHFFSLRKLADERGVSVESLITPFPVETEEFALKLGVMLCEDGWPGDYTHNPGLILKQNGADILIDLSCSPWGWQKNRKRDQVMRDLCRQTNLPLVYVNNIGVQNNGKNFITFDGGSTIYDRNGNIVSLIEPSKTEVLMLYYRERLSVRKRMEESDTAQLYHALVVGACGYFDTLPNGADRKIIIGASGGADSSLSLAFFAHVFGAERVIAVNMPKLGFSSQETQCDAELLAKRLGVEYRVCPIDSLVEATAAAAGIVEGTAQHKTIQAMARMQMLAAIAAKEHGIFTCNTNWTEGAFGYGTLNGDLRGAFAPWLNCLKQDIYRLLDYMNKEVFRKPIIPQSIFDRPPMDELTADGSGGRGDPFNYGSVTQNGYHDQMVRAFIAFRRSPEWFLEHYAAGTLESELRLPEGKLKQLFPTAEAFVDDLERCVLLIENSVFKRVQSVPTVLVDKRSFGWDYRESILNVGHTKRYCDLRDRVVGRVRGAIETLLI